MSVELNAAGDKATNKRIFVLGVGAQKAGTTWLHSYIQSCSDANMGFAKEYHVWDAISSPLCKEFKVTRAALPRCKVHDLLRFCMQEMSGFYSAYFNSIYNEGARITGDITPSYACLSEGDLLKVRRVIEELGATVKCVFLMRDPVERCRSAVSMAIRDRGGLLDEERLLMAHYSTERFQFRTRYDLTHMRLCNVFSDEELYIGFYETMFCIEELRRLSQFLCIPVNSEFRNQRFNVSPRAHEISLASLREVREFYSETYGYCSKLFPHVQQIWNYS